MKLKSEEKMVFTNSAGCLIWKSPEKKKTLDDCRKFSRLKYEDLLPESDNVNNFSSQETIFQSQETKTIRAHVKEKQFFHLLQVQLSTLLQMTTEGIRNGGEEAPRK